MRLMTVLLAAVGLGACTAGHAQEAGPPIEQNFAVANFDRIEVAGPYRVNVVLGQAPSVHARGGRNALAQMVVEVDGGTLKIHPRDRHSFQFGWMRHSGDIAVAVTAPALVGAALAGSGDIAVDHVRGLEFHGEIAGSGALTVHQLEVDRANLEIAGSGDIRAAGHARQVNYKIAGSGDVDARNLATQDAKVEIMGSGGVKAHATGQADVEIMGSGDVDLTGGAKCSVSKHGSGAVRCS